VELHHGTIAVQNRTDRSGFVVGFALPLARRTITN
jgi:hypothetical protein